MISSFRRSGRLVQFLSVRPQFNAHQVLTDEHGVVKEVVDLSESDVRINGGFFVCRRELLDEIQPGDELVAETFERLIPRGEVVAYPYEGFSGRWTRSRIDSGSRTCSRVAAPRGDVPADRARAPGVLMHSLTLGCSPSIRRVLAIGCHADDIEIGCGATILALLREVEGIELTWVVLAAEGERAEEARHSATLFLGATSRAEIVVHGFRDGFLPYRGEAVKEAFEELRAIEPELVLTHTRDDLTRITGWRAS